MGELKKLATKYKNITFLESVLNMGIPRFIQNALPNKFFEFIQARLGVVIGPSIEMRHYVEDYGLGIVAGDFSPASIASLLNSLDRDQIRTFKSNSHLAAKELSVDKELVNFSRIVKQIS